jgi:hypothetical protein
MCSISAGTNVKQTKPPTTSMLPNGNKEPLNMEKRNWKEYLRKLGWAGVIFFTVKGTITLLFGAWILQKLGCEP